MAKKESKRKVEKEPKEKVTKPVYKSYPVRIRIVSQKGACSFCHKVGDEWIYKYEPGKTPEIPNICDASLNMLFIYLRALSWGAPKPTPGPDPDRFLAACPDPNNPVVFELKRLKDQPIYFHFPDLLTSRLNNSKTNSNIKSKKRS